MEQISFMAEFGNPNKTDLQVCEAISTQTMCVKFYLNVGVNRGNLTTSSMMETKVGKKSTLHLINNVEINAHRIIRSLTPV